MILHKSILIASITCIFVSSVISDALADTDSVKIEGFKVHQTNKLNDLLPQIKTESDIYHEAGKYKSRYERINLLVFNNGYCTRIREINVEQNKSFLKYNSCVSRGKKLIIGKIENPINNPKILVYWINGKLEIAADTADPTRKIIWFFKEGELVAQLILTSSEDILKTSFTSKEHQEATNKAVVLTNVLSEQLFLHDIK